MIPLHPLIASRRSSRAFDPSRQVEDEVLRSLLEAARWAPSGNNLQPWHYVIFNHQDPAALEAARACLDEGNQVWARRAPLLLLAVMKETRPNGTIHPRAMHDLGAANENLLLQAFSLGLHCRPMGGFDASQASGLAGLSEGYKAVVFIALGYPAPVEDLPAEVQLKEAEPRTRRAVDAFTFSSHWGRPYFSPTPKED
ncbi:MAG TPA: nitroreductase family protein [Anaerolineaceae bacterium]|nr:nitroreductase family protein [Anaerolineaceae bacterium]HPN52893.1 nitroreductase family protein [Anaerolineaceae bacterium]